MNDRHQISLSSGWNSKLKLIEDLIDLNPREHLDEI